VLVQPGQRRVEGGEGSGVQVGPPRKEVEALVAGLTQGEIRGTVGPAPAKKLAAKAKVPEGERPYAHPYYWAAFVLIGDPD
jgi:hypothetical protein